MTKKKLVTICGHDYQIFYVPRIREANGNLCDDLGQTDSDKREIKIRTVGQTKSAQNDTLLHEIIHAILRTSGAVHILEDENETRVEEVLVRAMECGLTNIVKFKTGAIRELKN